MQIPMPLQEAVLRALEGYSPAVLAAAMSERPARAFGLWGKKGALLPGFDADVVLVDPERQWTITAESLCYVNKISAFVGMEGQGLPVTTLVRGQIVAANGRPTGQPGFGQLVKKQ